MRVPFGTGPGADPDGECFPLFPYNFIPATYEVKQFLFLVEVRGDTATRVPGGVACVGTMFGGTSFYDYKYTAVTVPAKVPEVGLPEGYPGAVEVAISEWDVKDMSAVLFFDGFFFSV